MFAIALAVLAFGADPTSADFAKAREEYDSGIARAEKAIEEERASLAKKYLGQLREIQKSSSPLVRNAAKAEVERVEKPKPTAVLPKIAIPTGEVRIWTVKQGNCDLVFDGEKARFPDPLGTSPPAIYTFAVKAWGLHAVGDGGVNMSWTMGMDGQYYVVFYKPDGRDGGGGRAVDMGLGRQAQPKK